MSYQHQILGTIISSVLNYDQLCRTMEENPAIDNGKSTYVPCDGRSIVGSQLEKRTAMKNAPDARGRFLRGLNVLYSVGEPLPFNPQTDGDPQLNRIVGDTQGDLLLAHTHPARGQINGSVSGSNNTTDVEEGHDKYNSDPRSGDHKVVVDIDNNTNGGAETRPRNISVYYYLKIN